MPSGRLGSSAKAELGVTIAAVISRPPTAKAPSTFPGVLRTQLWDNQLFTIVIAFVAFISHSSINFFMVSLTVWP